MKNYEKIGRVNGVEQLDDGRVVVDYTPLLSSRGRMIFNNKECFESWLLGDSEKWVDPYKPNGFPHDGITIAFCHKCGGIVPLMADVKTKKVTLPKCKCGYENKIENLKAFLSSKKTEYKGEYR